MVLVTHSTSGVRARLHAGLYYGVQRFRGSVSQPHIREAAVLLDGSADALRAHVQARLGAVHGAVGETMQWLERQPLVDRQSLRDEAALAVAVRGARREVRRTSGSTGVPFALPRDMAMSARMDAVMWAVYAWHGITPGLPHARFWGMPPAGVPRLRRRLSDVVANRLRLDAFDLARGQAVQFHQRLRRFAPAYAYGYPSLIRHFIGECAAAGLDGRELGLRLVISTGELITEAQRRTIADYFGCVVINEYGCTESGVLGFECEAGSMHLIPIAAFPQVVHADGRSTNPGEAGEVVVSDLYGALLPLLRYRLHDRGALLPGSCACGRALPLLRVDVGRLDDFILTPHRGPVYDAILAYTMPAVVQRFRARQVAPDQLVVELVPGPGFDRAGTPATCRAALELALGPGLSITTHVVDHIPHDPSGKLRYFIPLAEGATLTVPPTTPAEA